MQFVADEQQFKDNFKTKTDSIHLDIRQIHEVTQNSELEQEI